MAFSYQTGNKTVSVIQPIFEHYPGIKASIYYQHTTATRKLKDFINGLQNDRILSRTVRFLVTKGFQ